MKSLRIEGTQDTPQIILDLDSDILEISGRSLPEDVITFYEPVMNWIEEYSRNPKKNTIFNFKLVYFNTASSKVILDILTHFEEMVEQGHNVLVRWYWEEEDDDMLEAGEEYAGMVDVPFEMISIY